MSTSEQFLTTGPFILFGIFYLIAIVYILFKRQATSRELRILVTYLGVLSLASFAQAAQLPLLDGSGYLGIGLLLVSVLLLQQFRVLLTPPSRRTLWIWWVLGAIWLGGYITIGIMQPISAIWVLLIGWLVFSLQMALYIVRIFRRTRLAFSRRQMLYWIIVLLLVVTGQVLGMLGMVTWANLPLFIGSMVLTYVVIAPQPLDFLRLVRQVLTTLVLGGITVLLYGVAWLGLSSIPNLDAQVALWLPGLISLIFLIIFYRILWRAAERLVRRILPGTDFDTNRIIREYSLSISNILDPQRLATVSVGLISEAIEVQRGILLLVFREQVGDINGYRLKGSTGMGIPAPEDGILDAVSPIASHFVHEHEPLTQHMLDFAPEFMDLPDSEISWLRNLDVDIFVPIYAKDDWIGLLALGSKASGQPYMEEDLLLLRILADQTAVALQNARLVDSLMRVNNDFRRAYSAMDQSNRQLARANTQLEKLDRAKSDFIAIASHELRTPLTVMRGYTEMLQDDPMVKDNSYYEKLVNGIHSGIMRFHEIVDGMLDIAMIDNSTLNLSVNDVSLDVLIRIVCNGLKKAVEERNVTLDVENLEQIPAIQGDPEALRKVFYHLIVNAIKYTPDGGKVTLSGHKVGVGEHGITGEGVEIIVSDTGIGIDPEYHDLIFVKFYQTGEIALHSSGKTKFKGGGPGLGLTVSKGIVEAHGGRIWVESEYHDEDRCPGSQFHVVLPVRIHTQ